MFISDKDRLNTNVLSCTKLDNEKYSVVLEDTIFYAESGGQPSDKGTINGLEVLDVYYYNNEICHLVNNEVNGLVECVLNTETRHRHSLFHTAQHLVSAVFDKEESWTSSFTIKEDHFTIELSKIHSREELDQKEVYINELISQGIDINIRNYNDETDSNVEIPDGVNKKDVRLVCIGELDKNACGGTHLGNISEIKYIKILKIKPSRGGIRIWVTAGGYAIRKMQEVFNRYTEITQKVGCDESKLVSLIEEKFKEHKKMKKTLKKLSKQYDITV